jgi:fumarate reductase subunit D
VLVALAGASFFRHPLAVLLLFLALPLGLLLGAAFGTGVSVFAIGLLAAVIAVIHTIADTLRLLRAANRPTRKSSPTLAHDRAEKSRSERSRIAA